MEARKEEKTVGEYRITIENRDNGIRLEAHRDGKSVAIALFSNFPHHTQNECQMSIGVSDPNEMVVEKAYYKKLGLRKKTGTMIATLLIKLGRDEARKRGWTRIFYGHEDRKKVFGSRHTEIKPIHRKHHI